MSDNIPFHIQLEIIKKVSGVKWLVRLRSVSKPWKSFIDSSQFIKSYGARHTQPHSHFLSYKSDWFLDDIDYICLADDDNNETFKVEQKELAPFVPSHLHKQYEVYKMVGVCHGLVCLYGFHQGYNEWVLVIWNPSIGKSFCIAASRTTYNSHYHSTDYGFGVCSVTKDPTVLKIIQRHNEPWHVEVFTLSSRVWNVIPVSSFPRESIVLDLKTQVVIDRFIYWGASEKTINDDGEATTNRIVVSFDLITKEFKVVHLPESVTNELYGPVSISNLRDSLVVSGSISVDGVECCDVWVMERDSSFIKLFTIDKRVSQILGFSKSGEPIFEIRKEGVTLTTTLDIYNPYSQQIKSLGISGVQNSFFMASYKESLLLLNHSDSDLRIHYDDNLSMLRATFQGLDLPSECYLWREGPS